MTGRPTLRTARLVLHPLSPGHLPFLRRLDGDAEVLRFILGRARTPAEADEHWAPVIAAQSHAALGMWVGSLDGVEVGWWSLRPDDERPHEAEAGWRLARAFWGRGLAREGARRLFDHGFDEGGLQRIHAETMAANIASQRVMAALGMSHVRTTVREWDEPLPGAELGEVIAAVNREDWRAAHPRPD